MERGERAELWRSADVMRPCGSAERHVAQVEAELEEARGAKMKRRLALEQRALIAMSFSSRTLLARARVRTTSGTRNSTHEHLSKYHRAEARWVGGLLAAASATGMLLSQSPWMGSRRRRKQTSGPTRLR